jgi:NitT/TauT family transport system permease protein
MSVAVRRGRQRGLRILGTSLEAWLATLLLIVVWRIAAQFSKPFLIPAPERVWDELLNIARNVTLLHSVGVSFARILGGLAISFTLGLLLGVAMGSFPRVASFAHTYLNFIQGIPSLCWIVIAIIWFRDAEVRILFIVTMATLPSFTLQVYDGYRSISQELKEMVRSLRPSICQRFRCLTFPALLPPILTIWRINLGAGTRDVVIAELVGSSAGIGLQINLAEESFSMARIISWTVVLVLFVLVTQKFLSLVEGRVLRWRPDAARQAAADRRLVASLPLAGTVGERV